MLSFSIYLYKMKIFLYKWINAFFGELHPLFFSCCSMPVLCCCCCHSHSILCAPIWEFFFFIIIIYFATLFLLILFFRLFFLPHPPYNFFCSSYSSSSSRNCSKFVEPFSSKWTYKLNILYFNCGSVAACAACVQMNVFCSSECQALDELKLNVHWCHIWQIKISFLVIMENNSSF